MMASEADIPHVEIKNLGCSRAGRKIFENIGFSLKSGSLLIIEGRNGSGKTSLLRILAGLLNNDAVDIILSGPDFS